MTTAISLRIASLLLFDTLVTQKVRLRKSGNLEPEGAIPPEGGN
jgi:hypothetical protein